MLKIKRKALKGEIHFDNITHYPS